MRQDSGFWQHLSARSVRGDVAPFACRPHVPRLTPACLERQSSRTAQLCSKNVGFEMCSSGTVCVPGAVAVVSGDIQAGVVNAGFNDAVTQEICVLLCCFLEP